MAPTYEQLAKVRNPEYKLHYWRELRALYSGGERLLHDAALLQEMLPQHRFEEPGVYAERCRRGVATYVNYTGQLIDFMVAALSGSPITLKFEPENVDPFYHEFYEDTTTANIRKESLNQLLRRMLLTALQCRTAWIQLDLPERGQMEIYSLADEEAAGLKNVYACLLEPEQVVDWEYDDDGELLWALVCDIGTKRETLDAKRDKIRETYCYYDRESWQRWYFEYPLNQSGEPIFPPATQEATLQNQGKHSFGKVPLLQFCLPEGLWAGNKLANLAVSHFNKRSAFDWGQRRTLFQFLKVTLSSPDPLNPVSDDARRGTNQIVGPGRAMVLAAGDDVAYVSPAAEPFKIALEDMKDLRDEMMRVVHHMALSQDNSAGALKRSGDSKKQDAAATVVVLKGLGELLREFAEEIVELCSRGRGEYGTFEVEAQGMDEFDDVTLSDMVTEAGIVHTQLSPKSAHFMKRYDLKVYKKLLGTDLTEQDVEIMQQELDTNVTNEDLTLGAAAQHMEPDGDEPVPPEKAAEQPPAEKAPAEKPADKKKPKK